MAIAIAARNDKRPDHCNQWNSNSAIAKLDKYHLLILDDLAYVAKDQAETSVLFELISARYEQPFHPHHSQSALRRMEQGLPRSRHDPRGG